MATGHITHTAPIVTDTRRITIDRIAMTAIGYTEISVGVAEELDTIIVGNRVALDILEGFDRFRAGVFAAAEVVKAGADDSMMPEGLSSALIGEYRPFVSPLISC